MRVRSLPSQPPTHFITSLYLPNLSSLIRLRNRYCFAGRFKHSFITYGWYQNYVIKFIIYFVLVNTGLIFRWLHWRAEEECDKVSDQCADAGFGWEALGSILLLCSHILLIFILISWGISWIKLRNRK